MRTTPSWVGETVRSSFWRAPGANAQVLLANSELPSDAFYAQFAGLFRESCQARPRRGYEFEQRTRTGGLGMFRRSKTTVLKEKATSGKDLAVALGQDKKFRKQLLSAIGHGAVARRRAASRIGFVAAVSRLSADQKLRRELRQMTENLQRAVTRAEKKRSHRLRNSVIIIGLGGAVAAVPQSRRWLSSLVGRGSSPRTITESIEVGAPVSTAYNQWTQFEDFPLFMEGVDHVQQLDDTRLHWAATIAGRKAEWNAKILEQHPDRQISWISEDGKKTRGTVTFDKRGDGRVARRSLSGDDRAVATTGRARRLRPAGRRRDAGGPPGSTHAGHRRLAALHDLLGREVLLVRGDLPLVPERIRDLAEAVAPELVLDRHRHGRARVDRLLNDLVDVLDVQEDADGCATELLRRRQGRLRHWIGEHEHGVADLQLGVSDGVLRTRHAPTLLCTERPLVELDRLRRVFNGEGRGEGVIVLGNRFCHGPPFCGS